MEHSEQEEHLWAKRFELFGKDAETIWDQELPEAEKRYDEVQDVVALLHKSKGMAMRPVYTLLNTFEQNIVPSRTVIQSKGTIAQTILGLE